MRTLLLTAAIVLAGVSTARAEDSYLPLAEKATWTYARTSKTDVAGVGVVTASSTVTGTCKGKDKLGAETCWIVEWTENGEDDSGEAKYACKTWVRGGPDSITVLRTTGTAVWLLPADFKAKKETVKVKCKSSDVECETTVGEEEEVKTPAGKLRAIKVTNDAAGGGRRVQTTAWYAKETGLVRLVQLTESPGSKITDELVLKKFTKGKPEESSKTEDKDLFLPTKEGTTWTYRHEEATGPVGSEQVQIKEKVTCVAKGREKLGDAEFTILEWDGGSGSTFNAKVWVRADAGGVSVSKTTAASDLWVLPLDLRAKTAKVTVRCAKDDVTVESTAGDEESVTVPAGTYRAIKVKGSVGLAGTFVEWTVWYAKGVGIVKVERLVEAGAARVHDRLVLKKAGKD